MALAGIAPATFSGNLARRISLAGLLTPIARGGTIADLKFLYASRRRNRFTPKGGPQTIYLGEDEEVGSAETKRVALLGSFAKTKADPASVFWAHAHLPDAVLDLTDPSVLAALGATDAELHDADWRDCRPLSSSERLGYAAYGCGRFAAIKYWSVRARMDEKTAFCFCIFKARVRAPLRVDFESKPLGLAEHWGG